MYDQLICSLFLQNPDQYNTAVPVLLKRLSSSLSPLEFETVLKAAQNRLKNISSDFALEHEFDLLLMEHHIAEGLSGYQTMSVMGAAYELVMLGVNFPKLPDGRPIPSQDFWLGFFEELPEDIQHKVWQKAGRYSL